MKSLKQLIADRGCLEVLGAHDALSALLIEQAGEAAVYVGSYATSASAYGLPDLGLLSAAELATHAGNVARAVQIPVIADAENGFFGASQIGRTVDLFESQGIAAIHIEDVASGKHSGNEVFFDAAQMADQIRAAVAARTNPDFAIIGRTDVLRGDEDLPEVVERVNAYRLAGADIVFIENCGPAQLAKIRADIDAPVMIVNRTDFTLAAARAAGAQLVLVHAFSLAVAYRAIREALATRRRDPQAFHHTAFSQVRPDLEALTHSRR